MSLLGQTARIDEVIIVHAGTDDRTEALVRDPRWQEQGLRCRYYSYPERNVAAQRNFAVSCSRCEWLVFLDDDVELFPTWTEEMLRPMINDPDVAATMGINVNQPFVTPPRWWRLYHRFVVGRQVEEAPGKVVGAVLANGFVPLPSEPTPVEWIGGGNSAIRRSAFLRVGGFAPYFRGSSPGEDIDLGYRLSRTWKVLFVPAAKLHHHQAPGGREPMHRHQAASMMSRYAILRRAMGRGYLAALWHIALWATFQSCSEILALRKGISLRFLAGWWGRLKGLAVCTFWTPPALPPPGEPSALPRAESCP